MEKKMKEIDKELLESFQAAFRATYNPGDRDAQLKATRFLAKAFTLPLRQGIMAGENGIMDIFQTIPFSHGRHYEWSIDLLAPGTENDFTAWVIPREGDMPTNQVKGDYVSIPTYEVGNAISWRTQFARDADYSVLARCMEIMEAGFVKKRNDDGWHVVIAAGFDRNIVVFDPDASIGEFTPLVVSNAKVTFRRNGGGNAQSIQPRKLTDLYLSPEAIEGMRGWGVDKVDEVTRREIYVSEDVGGRLSRVFGVNLHDTFELGEGQEYQQYYSDLGGALASGDVELGIGVNQNASHSFVHPVREELQIYPHERLNDYRLSGLWGFEESGWGSMDGRDCVIISM